MALNLAMFLHCFQPGFQIHPSLRTWWATPPLQRQRLRWARARNCWTWWGSHRHPQISPSRLRLEAVGDGRICFGWWWLEHGFYDFPYIGNGKSSQRTNFFRGVGLNHQPDIVCRVVPPYLSPNIPFLSFTFMVDRSRTSLVALWPGTGRAAKR